MKIKENKKRKNLSIVLLLAILIVVAIISRLAYAKYTTSLNGDTVLQIAKWSFKVSDGTNENDIKINLANTRIVGDTESVQSNYIGPRNKWSV